MITAFLIMSSLLVVLGIFAILYTNRMQENTRRILEENVSSLKAAEELELALLDMKGLTSYFLLDGNEKWLDIFEQKKATFLYWREEAQKKIHSDAELAILSNIDTLYSAYTSAQLQAVQQAQKGHADAAHLLLTSDMFFLFDRIYDQCESLLLINEKMMFSASSLVERDSRTVNYIVYGMAFSSILLGLGLGLLLSSRITQPIYNLVLRIQSATGEQTSIVEQINATDLTEFEHLDALIQRLIAKVREANEEVQKSEKLLIRAEKYAIVGRLAASVAHEIRNPLTAIKMLMFTLRDGLDKASPLRPDVAVMIQEIGRIEKFVQDFLDFSRPPKPVLKDHAIVDILKTTISLLMPQLKQQTISIDMQGDAGNSIVCVDEQQIKQVFLNILINAIQAMPNGGTIRIKNSHHQQSENRRYLCLTIQDAGPGIEESLMPTIFDPFSTTKEDGTGLGLSIADQIIHNHAGWIEAHNAEPHGAVFSIYLPLKQQDES